RPRSGTSTSGCSTALRGAISPSSRWNGLPSTIVPSRPSAWWQPAQPRFTAISSSRKARLRHHDRQPLLPVSPSEPGSTLWLGLGLCRLGLARAGRRGRSTSAGALRGRASRTRPRPPGRGGPAHDDAAGNLAKGRSSRFLRREFPKLRSRIPTLWTNSYFVSTVGGSPLSVVKQYIENQKRV